MDTLWKGNVITIILQLKFEKFTSFDLAILILVIYPKEMLV